MSTSEKSEERKLKSMDSVAFVAHFLEVTKGLNPVEVSQVVWRYGGQEWSRGFNQGKNDPDFEEDEEQDELSELDESERQQTMKTQEK
jgi:hypothetical protein